GFRELHRDTPVHVVVPRSYRRLCRVLHPFGPLSPALFHLMGGGAEAGCLEDDFGPDAPVVMEAARFLRGIERTLDRRGIPFAVINGDLLGYALEHGRWTILVSSGALGPDLIARLDTALGDG